MHPYRGEGAKKATPPSWSDRRRGTPEAAPHLQIMGKNIVHMGEPGPAGDEGVQPDRGWLTMQAVAEALTLAGEWGLYRPRPGSPSRRLRPEPDSRSPRQRCLNRDFSPVQGAASSART